MWLEEHTGGMYIDLVGLREISTRTGVTSNLAATWVRQTDFPEPVACLSIGDVWVWGPVRSWLQHEGHRTDVDIDPQRTDVYAALKVLPEHPAAPS